MGILNVTPDSFSDGGKYADINKAITHAEELIKAGADIIDIGGESTRPGAKTISLQEETDRVMPVIEAMGRFDIDISIDTRKPELAELAINAGAKIWNDVSALEFSDKSLSLAAKLDCQIVLMHMQGTPDTMQSSPGYTNVVKEVKNYLHARIKAAVKAGVKRENIIIDPGIGFGKTLENNLDLLHNLDEFHELSCPILLGASRKRFIDMIAPAPVDKRLGGSLAAALWGVSMGVDIVRVHDVFATKQAVTIWQEIMGRVN